MNPVPDTLTQRPPSLSSGALESIKESQRRSREAGRRVQSAGGVLGESSIKRQQADDLLKRNGEFERTLRQNENDLRDLDNRVDRLNSGIVDLNEKVSAAFPALHRPCLSPRPLESNAQTSMCQTTCARAPSREFRREMDLEHKWLNKRVRCLIRQMRNLSFVHIDISS